MPEADVSFDIGANINNATSNQMKSPSYLLIARKRPHDCSQHEFYISLASTR